MANLKQHPSSRASRLTAGRMNTSLPDETVLIRVDDSYGTQYTEHKSSIAFDRRREAVLLDRWYWFSIGMLLSTGTGLAIWTWIH